MTHKHQTPESYTTNIFCKICLEDIIIDWNTRDWVDHIRKYHWDIVQNNVEPHELFNMIFQFFFIPKIKDADEIREPAN